VKQKKQKNPGFTLVELILYIGLSSILLLVISLFLTTMLSARVKQQTISEVDEQGLQIMQIITQNIRNAEAVNSPTPGNSDSTLNLSVLDASKNPTIFNLNQNTLQIKEGSESNINLTNSKIDLSSLNFENLSRDGTPGMIRISFEMSYKNETSRQEYNYTKPFYTSVSLR